MPALRRKLDELVREHVQLRTDDYLRPRQKWTEEIVNKEMLRLLSVKTNRQLESQRLELYQANQWADQAKRKDLLIGELDMRNTIFQEEHAKILPSNSGITKNLL